MDEPASLFLQRCVKVFFDAAYRAHHKKLTSRASLELPALRAFDEYVQVVPSSLKRQDVVEGVHWEFLRQRAMYERLEELKEHFMLMGAPFTVVGPEERVAVGWRHEPSLGTWLLVGKEQYPALYAFPTMLAHAAYDAEPVVYADRALTIIIPRADENAPLLRNEKLQAPIRRIERDEVLKKKGWFGERVLGVERRRLEVSQRFVFADLPREVTDEDVEQWMKTYAAEAVVIGDRERDQTVLRCQLKLPALHAELRSIARKS